MEIQTGESDDLSDEGKAVGVWPGGGESKEDVTCFHIGAREEMCTLYSANSKASQVIVI